MPRSLELFTYLRIIDDVMKRAILTPMVRLYKMPEGVEPAHEFEMSPHRNPTPTNPFLNPVMLGQDKLEKIFHAALAEFGCTVELGTELKSFVQDSDHVKATLIKRGMSQDMESGEVEEVLFDWMIGADGAKGVVRKQLGLSFLGETRNVENFIVGDIMVDGLSQKYWHMWGDAANILISLRATETPKLFNFVVGGKNIKYSELAKNEALLKNCFVENTGRRPDLKFLEIPWMSTYTPNIRMVEKFGFGRIYVTGDAGHVHSPTGGQGMNTGIQDSFNLGWKLALVVKGLAKPSLLESFSEERIPVIAEMITQTTRLLNKTLGNDERSLKTSGTLFQLGVNYRWSPIVLDERKKIEADREAEEDAYLKDFEFGDEEDEEDRDKLDSYGAAHDGRLRAGDRAPDSSGLIIRSPPHHLKQVCQLFQIFGPAHHTVLIFADLVNSRDILRAVSVYPRGLIRTVVIVRPKKPVPADAGSADFILEDRDEHAYSAYCPTGVCGICVVRPDGVVGVIARGPTWLNRYFHGIFTAQTK
ncbi:pentachlorophenol 4-monooxygenase [Flammula alnicola]|nr:pentachlorophenol 4-monooxygenase [Flammula alnicola]